MSDNRVFKTLGASSHTDEEREINDYYATDSIAIDLLLSKEKFKGTIWEACCGELHLSNRLEHFGYKVINSDLVVRKEDCGIIGCDFLEANMLLGDNIVTNPPNKLAAEIIVKSMELLKDGGKLALFLPIRFLASQQRYKIYKKYPPKNVWISSDRIMCAKNGDFKTMKQNGGTAIDYMWIVWEKGYTGKTVIDFVSLKELQDEQ